MDKRIGIIGTGFMGSAMIKALCNSAEVDNSNVYIFDVDFDKAKNISNELGVNAVDDVKKLVECSDIVVLAVKPNIVGIVLEDIKDLISDKILASFAVGVPVSFYEGIIGDDKKVVRTMPNTPMTVGEGMTIVTFNSNISDGDKGEVISMFELTGKVSELSESLMTEVTALTGSSPAYVYMFIEAMVEGAIKQGIPGEIATELAAQTVYGSAKMVLETGVEPSELRDNVCSPNGTTIRAVESLEKNGFRYDIIEAMNECTKRGKEIEKDMRG